MYSTFTSRGTGNFFLSGGSLTGGAFSVNPSALFQISGGATLRNATVSGAKITFSVSGFLDNVTSSSNLDLTGGATVRVFNGLSLTNGAAANLNNGAVLAFGNSATTATTYNGNVLLGTTGTNRLNVEGYTALTLTGLVHGQGTVGLRQFDGGNNSLVNQGTLSSDSGGTLTVGGLGGGLVNQGTLQAKGAGSILNVTQSFNNTGGTINTTGGGTFTIDGITITGGQITSDTVNDGLQFSANASNVLDGVNLNGNTLNLTNGGVVRLLNVGTTLASGVAANLNNGAVLAFGNSATTATTYNGNVLLGTTGTNRLNVEGYTALTLTGLVHGQGTVGLRQFDGGNNSLVNQGTLSSDSGGTLTVGGLGGGLVNQGTLQAKGAGSILNVTQSFNNTGGTINTTGGGIFTIDGITITGGQITSDTVNDGLQFSANASNVLDGVNLNGNTLNLTNGGVVRLFNVGTTLASGVAANLNNGAVLAFGNSATTATTYNGNVLLGTTGTNRLNVEGYTALTLTGLVHGQGTVGLRQFDGGNNSLVNQGTLSSDSGGTLTVGGLGGGLVNQGTLQAKGAGSILNIAQSVDNTGGTINTTGGGIANINGSSITKGQVTGDGGLRFAGSNTLDGVTFNGANLNLTSGATVRVFNGLSMTNGAAASLDNGAYLAFGNSATTATTYNGNVLLGATGSNTLSPEGSTALTLTGLVHGQGSVGPARFDGGNNSLVNQGTLSADSGGTLTVGSLSGGLTNHGALDARNGGTLNITQPITSDGTVSTGSNGTVTFSSGSTLSQAGGTSQVDGVVNLGSPASTLTVNGGTLKGTGKVNGNVTNSGGTVAPGDSPGTLTVNGSFAQSGNGLLSIEFTKSSHDLLNVTGNAVTGGMVNFSFLDTSVAAGVVGQTFDFLSSTGLSTSITNAVFTSSRLQRTAGGLVTEAGPGGGVFRISRDRANNLQVTVVLSTLPPRRSPRSTRRLPLACWA